MVPSLLAEVGFGVMVPSLLAAVGFGVMSYSCA